jgi:hypothetical protein
MNFTFANCSDECPSTKRHMGECRGADETTASIEKNQNFGKIKRKVFETFSASLIIKTSFVSYV